MKTITAAGHEAGSRLGSCHAGNIKLELMIGMLILLHGAVINI
jgi:hypothetical protein